MPDDLSNFTYSPFEQQPVEAYPGQQSVAPGEAIAFHASVSQDLTDEVVCEIFRAQQIEIDDRFYGLPAANAYFYNFRNAIKIRPTENPVHVVKFPPSWTPMPADASQNGCVWPVSCTWQVPAATKSGVFVGRFSCGGFSTYVLFVVRVPRSVSGNKILVQISNNTHQAYNAFGGYCLYPPPTSLGFKNPVSFSRPCQLWDFALYEYHIVSWFDDLYAVDFCQNTDLHANPQLLDGYNLFVSIGHDEYWSRSMRSTVESFGLAGGNVMFLTGNTCYRPVRFKGTNNDQMERVTLEFGDLGRPEAMTTGLNWSAGRWSKPLPKQGFVVRQASHWAFRETGLQDGETFGDEDGVIGYETDAAVYNYQGDPIDPTPTDFETLATAYLPEWDDWYGRSATMGIFRRAGRGWVFNAGTTGWGRGLIRRDGVVDQITRNLVDELSV